MKNIIDKLNWKVNCLPNYTYKQAQNVISILDEFNLIMSALRVVSKACSTGYLIGAFLMNSLTNIC